MILMASSLCPCDGSSCVFCCWGGLPSSYLVSCCSVPRVGESDSLLDVRPIEIVGFVDEPNVDFPGQTEDVETALARVFEPQVDSYQWSQSEQEFKLPRAFHFYVRYPDGSTGKVQCSCPPLSVPLLSVASLSVPPLVWLDIASSLEIRAVILAGACADDAYQR